MSHPITAARFFQILASCGVPDVYGLVVRLWEQGVLVESANGYEFAEGTTMRSINEALRK